MAKNKKISALISDADPKNSSGSYGRLLGDEEMGRLMSKVHSASIRAGYLLEEIIADRARANLIPGGNLNKFVKACKKGKHSGVFLCTKEMIKASKYKVKKHELDMMVFDISNGRGSCDIIELKAGTAFDTKKSEGEKETLDTCRDAMESKLSFLTIKAHFCAFHAKDKDEIVEGTKGQFSKKEVMTGRKLCKILDIDYDEVVAEESASQEENMTYFIEEVSRIARRWKSRNH